MHKISKDYKEPNNTEIQVWVDLSGRPSPATNCRAVLEPIPILHISYLQPPPGGPSFW